MIFLMAAKEMGPGDTVHHIMGTKCNVVSSLTQTVTLIINFSTKVLDKDPQDFIHC